MPNLVIRSNLEENLLDGLLGDSFKLSLELVVLVPDHLVLGLLCSDRLLNLSHPCLNGLSQQSFALQVFLLLQPFNLKIHSRLRLQVLDVLPSHLHSRLLVNSLTFQQRSL